MRQKILFRRKLLSCSFFSQSVITQQLMRPQANIILNLVYAVKTSDMTSEVTPATWNSNEEALVPTDYTDKLAYFKKMYRSPSKC